MKKIYILLVGVVIIILIVVLVLNKKDEPIIPPVTNFEENNLIKLENPKPNQVVQNPLMITGEARGNWYFEASFPVILVNWDGLIIAESYATAKTDWMTEEFVPFEAVLEFENPYKPGDPDFMKRGAIILKKDNPSGLPENDDALEITIFFD